MTVRIKRNTGMIGVMRNFNLIVNGEKKGIIKNNETVEVEIPETEGTIQVVQTGIKNNKVIVEDGDRVELVNTIWGTYGPFSILFISPFVNRFPDLTSVFIGYILILIIVFAILYAFPGINYRIEKK